MDAVIYIPLALIFNLFAHKVTSVLYRDLDYDEKLHRSVVLLFIIGVAAIVISKILLKQKTIKKGMNIGGILLVITSLYANWENMTEEFKLIIFTMMFGTLLYYAHRKNSNKESVER